MTLEHFIDQFGYIAVLIGTFFEGETVLVLAGFAASRAYMALSGVMVAAFAGSFLGDQFFFYLGRAHGRKILHRFPSWPARVERAQELLNRFQTPLMIGFRFMLGLRTVTPFALGLSSVSAKRFFFFNAIGACLWAILISSGGYLFGQALEFFMEDLKHHEVQIIGGVAFAGIALWLLKFLRSRRAAREHKLR